MRYCGWLLSLNKRFISTGRETSSQSLDTLVPELKEIRKILKVSIIGAPNAGKSTLINSLVGTKVCSVSTKVHTTRCQARAALVSDNTQIVFVDTPGVVTQKEIKKHHLEQSFKDDPEKCGHYVDVLGVVHDVGNRFTRNSLNKQIVDILRQFNYKKSILILNKVDLIRNKQNLLHITRQLTNTQGKNVENNITKSIKTLDNVDEVTDEDSVRPSGRNWSGFDQVFMVSALTGDGTSELIDYMLGESKVGKWILPEGCVTDKPIENLITDVVKSKLLDFLPKEIPYELNVELEYLHQNELGEVVAVALVVCPVERLKRFLLSQGGKTIRQIALCAEEEIRTVLQASARLRLVATSLPPKKKWWEKR